MRPPSTGPPCRRSRAGAARRRTPCSRCAMSTTKTLAPSRKCCAPAASACAISISAAAISRRADLAEAELLVVLGGPLHAYDVDKYPFLRKEICADRDAARPAPRPCLGVGLGAHLMARALGARVTAGHAYRIGWAPLTPHARGHGEPVAPYHRPGAALAFRHLRAAARRRAPGLERGLRRRGLRLWPQRARPAIPRRGRRQEIRALADQPGAGDRRDAGISVTRLRADTARFARVTAAQGQRCLAEWLDQLQPRR